MTNPELAPDMPDYELMLLIETAKKYDRRECFADSGNGFSASIEYSNMLKTLQTRADLAPQAGSVDVEAVIDAVTSFYTRKEDRNFAAQVARNTLDNLLAGAPVGGDGHIKPSDYRDLICARIDTYENKLQKENGSEQTNSELRFAIEALRGVLCDCQCPEPESGVALVSMGCPIHNSATLPVPEQSPRPAIPSLQEAIAVLREEISVMENIITLNLEGNNKKTRRKLEQWKALYEAARQSGVPDGWREIDEGAKTGEDFVLTDARLKDVYVVAAYDKDEKFPWSTLDGQYHEKAFTHYIPRAIISAARDGRD